MRMFVRRSVVLVVCVVVVLSVLGTVAAEEPSPEDNRAHFKASEFGVTASTTDGTPVFTYNLRRPKEARLAVDSACFFHPVCTPGGMAVTDLAPSDHPHHRGVFFGFVEMRGAKHDGDFWGWGEHAPIEGRRIENVRVSHDNNNDNNNDKGDGDGDGGGAATATFDNVWKVGDAVMVDERLVASVRVRHDANVVDLDYRLTSREEIRLPRWAFSGFCVRLRKDGKIVYTSPDGVVDRPPLDHLKPQLDWPAAAWYDATVALEDGRHVGVAVVDHPSNPPCLWHNESRIHMLNPCIVAPGEMKLAAGKPLTLSYRLIVHDGPAPTKLIGKLAGEFREAKRESGK